MGPGPMGLDLLEISYHYYEAMAAYFHEILTHYGGT